MSNGTITMTGAEYDALAGKIAALEAELAKLRAVQDGFVLVPVEPTPEMVSAADEAHMPFGDMDIALRMATLSAPSPSATVQGDGWIPVSERLPKQNEKVLVTYTNRLGNCRRVIAELVAKHTVEASDDYWGYGADYDEATDQYYCPAGWYECVENWDELAYLAIHEGEVTHWMPLPATPAIAAAQEGVKV